MKSSKIGVLLERLRMIFGAGPYLRLIDKPVDLIADDEAHLFNWVLGHTGPSAQAGLWINSPVAIKHQRGGVTIRHVNERVVEIPYCIMAAGSLEPGARILDLGATESVLALHLATLGFKVTALDVRRYPFTHPNLTVAEAKAEEWEADPQSFEMIISLSAIEHAGTEAYGGVRQEDADRSIIERFARWLTPGGKLVLTVPFGTWSMDEFQRTYDRAHLLDLLAGWEVVQMRTFPQLDDFVWVEVDSDPSGHGVALITAMKD